MKSAKFCAYEHLGPCSEWLTHRVAYWIGRAREQFGPYAYYCSAHAREAEHLWPSKIDRPYLRRPKSDYVVKIKGAA